MQVISNELLVSFDVDGTLITECYESVLPPLDGYFKMVCPYTGKHKVIKAHKQHCRYLIEHKARGYTVIVWSNGGNRHAEAVVKALGLEHHVDIVMGKFSKTFDDQELNLICTRVYLNEI
jgi:phosphoserine phosphatase